MRDRSCLRVSGLWRKLGRTALGIPHLVWGMALVALLLRLVALWVFHGPDLVSASESGITAANWVSGQGYTFDLYGYRMEQPLQSFMPPLFTAVIASCLLTPWPELSMGLVQVLLSSLTVLLVYLIASLSRSFEILRLEPIAQHHSGFMRDHSHVRKIHLVSTNNNW